MADLLGDVLPVAWHKKYIMSEEITSHLISIIDDDPDRDDLLQFDIEESLTKEWLAQLVENLLEFDLNAAAYEAVPVQASIESITQSVAFQTARDVVQCASDTIREHLKKRKNETARKNSESFDKRNRHGSLSGCISLFDMLDQNPLRDFMTAGKIIDFHRSNEGSLAKVADLIEELQDLEHDISSPDEWQILRRILFDGIRLILSPKEDEEEHGKITQKHANEGTLREDNEEFLKTGFIIGGGDKVKTSIRFSHLHWKLFSDCELSNVAIKCDLFSNSLKVLLDVFERGPFFCAGPFFSLRTGLERWLGHLVYVFHEMLVGIGNILHLMPEEDVIRLLSMLFSLLRTTERKRHHMVEICLTASASPKCHGHHPVLLAHFLAAQDPRAMWFSLWVSKVPAYLLLKCLFGTGYMIDIVQRCASFGRTPLSLNVALEAYNLVRCKQMEPDGVRLVYSDMQDCLYLTSMLQMMCIVRTSGPLFPVHELLQWPGVTRDNFRQDSINSGIVNEGANNDIHVHLETGSTSNITFGHFIDENRKSGRVLMRESVGWHTIAPLSNPFLSVLKAGSNASNGILVDVFLSTLCAEALESILIRLSSPWDVFGSLFDEITPRIFDKEALSNLTTMPIQPITYALIRLLHRIKDWVLRKSMTTCTDEVVQDFKSSLDSIVHFVDAFVLALTNASSDLSHPASDTFTLVAALVGLLKPVSMFLAHNYVVKDASLLKFRSLSIDLGFEKEAILLIAEIFGFSLRGTLILEDAGLLPNCVESTQKEFMVYASNASFHLLRRLQYIITTLCGTRQGCTAFLRSLVFDDVLAFFVPLSFEGEKFCASHLCTLQDIFGLAEIIICGPWASKIERDNANHLREWILSASTSLSFAASESRFLALRETSPQEQQPAILIPAGKTPRETIT